MKKINNFKYENNGIVIVFTPCPIKNGEIQKYSFSVEGDMLLTEKILSSVKNKKIIEKYTGQCAKALFEIIRIGEFIAITSNEEINNLFEKFNKKFEEYPYFMIEDLSKRNMPLFSAKFVNEVPLSKTGQGRTKQEARADALKNLFENVSI